MRWWTFSIFAYLALALELGLRPLWVVSIAGGVAPSLVIVLTVFVSLWAPAIPAGWACLILGILIDLIHPWAFPGMVNDVAIIGPATIGFLSAGYITYRMRPLVFRDSPITLAALSFIAGLCVHFFVIFFLWARTWSVPVIPWLAASPVAIAPNTGYGQFLAAEALRRFWEIVYTAALAGPVGWCLMKTLKWWSFTPARLGDRR